ncbi:hypothetical protein [Winogradskyella sp.]|uniref:hypothetical protein n=1 Tax=Winogradskyella sp. TaxID=1883156 RepID=UPI003F6D5DA3
MKTLKMLVLVVAIAFSSVLAASTNPIEEAQPSTLTEAVGDLLKNPDFQLTKDVNAVVDLIINENDEMVVISVSTDNKAVERYIKNRLNYKKLSKDAIGLNRSFKVPIKMVETN